MRLSLRQALEDLELDVLQPEDDPSRGRIAANRRQVDSREDRLDQCEVVGVRLEKRLDSSREPWRQKLVHEV